MGIGNLGNKVGNEDIERVREKRNPPEYEPGFEPAGGDDGDLEGLFQDLGDGFGQPSAGQPGFEQPGFGQPGFEQPGFGQPGFEQPGFGQPGFGQPGFGQPGFGQPGFGQPGFGQPEKKEKKTDVTDKAIEFTSASCLSLGKILAELVKSIKLRTADDLAYYGANSIYMGAGCLVVFVVFLLLSITLDVPALGIRKLGGQILKTGILASCWGLIIFGTGSLLVANRGKTQSHDLKLEEVPDVSKTDEEDESEEYQDKFQEFLDGLDLDDVPEEKTEFEIMSEKLNKDDDEDNSVLNDEKNSSGWASNKEFSNTWKGTGTQSLSSPPSETVRENMLLTRRTLLEAFIPFFNESTVEFSSRNWISPDSQEFIQLETIVLKALCNLVNTTIEEIPSHLEEAYSTYFAYELRVKRINKLNRFTDIAREMESYFREGCEDKSVNASVNSEGDFYKIVVTKGVKAIVSFGDCFKKDEVKNFYYDEKNRLPIIVGIDELGHVQLLDAARVSTMMIAGKPRSGKTWYILGILMSLIMFNTPEEVQLLIIDPKESNLFKTLSLMPHVMGLHNGDTILQIFEEIIEVEGARRKRLLEANRCDSIWELWEKGIKLPVLYIVVDEVLTIQDKLGSAKTIFDTKMKTIISQLPSVGIRLVFVPHRATGVIDKTNRTMIDYAVAVMANPEDVRDTLSIKKWDRTLTQPGDCAINYEGGIKYLKSAAIATSDARSSDLVLETAKAYYKMGVDQYDMSHLGICCTRNESMIRSQLEYNTNRHQYNVNNIFDGI